MALHTVLVVRSPCLPGPTALRGVCGTGVLLRTGRRGLGASCWGRSGTRLECGTGEALGAGLVACFHWNVLTFIRDVAV